LFSEHGFTNYMRLLPYQLNPWAQPALHFLGGSIFIEFHPMTLSRLFNRGTTFSQTVTERALFATFPIMRTFKFNQDADPTIRTG